MNNKAKYSQLLSLFQSSRKKQLLLLLLCTVSLFMDMYLLYQIQGVLDCLLAKQGKEVFAALLWRIGLTGILSFSLAVYQMRMWHYFRNQLINEMRIHLFDKLLKKKTAFFDSQTCGAIASGVMNDGAIIAENAGISILMLILNLLHLLVIFGILFYRQKEIGFLTFFLSLLYLALTTWINGSMRKNYLLQQNEYADLNQSLLENIKGILEIKTLAKQDFFAQKFRQRIWKKHFPAVQRVIALQVEMTALHSVMKLLLPVAVLCYGAYFFYQGALSIGALVLCYVLVGQLVEPLQNLGDFYQGKQMALGSAERVYDFLFGEEEDAASGEELQNAASLRIDIPGFFFGEHELLKNFKGEAQKGDRIFIRGPSGCGKSTLLKILCRLYPLEDGEILIGKQALPKIGRKHLYEKLGILFQEPLIFEGSLLENLTLGDSIAEDKILSVLAMVEMEEFVLKYGLTYPLQENGKNLSGGQKQRLCLARILLRKPEILLLDEATSALDAATEQKVLAHIQDYILENQGILLAVSHSEAFGDICNQQWVLKGK